MKKICAIVLSVVMLCSVFCLSGCGEKVSITAEDFRARMEAKGIIVGDATEQFAEYDHVTKVYIAVLGDGDHQIEFYETTTPEAAQRMFAGNKQTFEQSIVNSQTQSSASMANYNSFRATADGYYKVLSRIDNTLIYVNSPAEYKSEIQAILKEIGY